MVKILKNLALVGVFLGALQPMEMSAVGEKTGKPATSWFTTDHLVYGVGVLAAVAGLAFTYVNPTDIKVWLYGMNDELIEAAEDGDPVAVKELIKNGANVNTKDEYETTPLHGAVEGGNRFIVEYLIKKGADVNAKDSWGNTALHDAARKDNRLDIVTYLVNHGANINAKTNRDKTALHIAAENNQLEVIKYLVGKGADFNVKDDENNTALHLAAENNQLEVVKYLVEKGAKVDEKNNNKKTPLKIAQKGKQTPVVAYLKLVEDFFAVIADNMNPETFIDNYLSKYLSEQNKLQLNNNIAYMRGLLLFGNEKIAKQLYEWCQKNNLLEQSKQFYVLTDCYNPNSI